MPEKAKRVLGRGLDALLPSVETVSKKVVEVEIGRIKPSRKQPREKIDENSLNELVLSIKEHGIIQPILVRPISEGEYEIIAGERRWRAAQKAGLNSVPVIIKEVEDVKMVEIALVENIQREDLNPIELARAYKMILDNFDLTQEELAIKVGKDRATIANTLRLLSLSEKVQKALIDGLISVGHAKAILCLKSETEQEKVLYEILKRDLTVREVENLVSKGSKKIREKENIDKEPNTLEAEKEMTRKLGLKVEIKRKKSGGVVRIYFKSEEELHHLWEWICKSGGKR